MVTQPANGSEARADMGGSDTIQVGDKIAILSGEYAGARAVVRGLRADGQVDVERSGGKLITLSEHDLRNYSLSARRAWATLPKRAGRPKLAAPRKKMASFRLDVDVIELLQEAERRGLIDTKSEAVNRMLREHLEGMLENVPAQAATMHSPTR